MYETREIQRSFKGNPLSGREVSGMTHKALELRLFGAFGAFVDGVPLPRLRSRKGLWLLALLALRPGRSVSREWLAQTLWPDSEPSQAFYNLRQCLTDLRHALGSEADCLLAPTPQTLSLDVARTGVDVIAFDAAIANGSLPALEQAIGLYQGSLLEGCSEEWAVSERALREQHYFTALETLANATMARQQPARSVPYLRLLVAADPFREAAHGVLMQALADCGDHAAVTQVYRDLRLRLHSELNAAPAPATDALYKRLQQQAKQLSPFSLPTAPQSASGLSNLSGERPAALPPRRLPVPLTRLIGRETEIQEVTALLQSDRLVTLTGAGGVGKTRLALAVGEALAGTGGVPAEARALEGFKGWEGREEKEWRGREGGAWFVELAALSEPGRILPAIMKTLGLQEQPLRPLLETLADALNAHFLLLILDNCEHLSEDCARIACDLLAACPGLRVLASSRQPLGITGERVYRVPSLPLPPPLLPETANAPADLQALQTYAGIQLFVERAAASQPDFRFTARNARAVAQICCHLDGIPLALELAAARLRSLAVEEVLARLQDRFALLTSGTRTILPRHRTLRALIDWSYDLLDDEEQALLRYLSVFSGGWTLEAAQTIGAPPEAGEQPVSADVLNCLTALVDKSLVIADAQGSAARYRMLETVRQYSGERLREKRVGESGKQETAQRQHRDFFLALAEESALSANKPQQPWWFARLEAEHDNLRTALAWCQERPDESEAEFRFAMALYTFWYLRGHLREGRECMKQAAARAADTGQTLWQARMLLRAGALARMQGDFKDASRVLAEALPLAQSAGETGLEAYLLTLSGSIELTNGDTDSALHLLEWALNVARKGSHRYAESECLVWMGDAARWRGDYVAARTFYTEGLEIAQTLEDAWFAANASGMMAELALLQGNIEEAGRLVRVALHGYVQTGDKIYCVQILEYGGGRGLRNRPAGTRGPTFRRRGTPAPHAASPLARSRTSNLSQTRLRCSEYNGHGRVRRRSRDRPRHGMGAGDSLRPRSQQLSVL